MRKNRIEEKYESFLNGEMKQKWENLKIKFDNKEIKSKDEYEEYKKMEKIQKHLPMVKNLLDTKNELKRLREAIIEELSERENIHNENKQIQAERKKIAKDHDALMQKEESLMEALKNQTLSDDKRLKLEEELTEVRNKKQLNDKEYLENIKKEPKADDKTKLLGEMDKKDLENKAVKLKIKMDICEFYMASLLKGQDLSNIKQNQESKNWKDNSKEYKKQLKEEVKRYTCSKEQKEKLNNLKEISKTDNVQTKEQQKEGKHEKVKEKQIDLNETSIVPVSDFDKKHPRLASIKNWFKKVVQKISKKTEKEEIKDEDIKNIEEALEKNFEQQMKDEKQERQNEQQKEIRPEEQEKSKREAFMEDLKFFESIDMSKVAESGFEDLKIKQKEEEQSKKKDDKISAIQKLIDAKKNAGEGKDGGSIAKLEAKLADLNGDDKGEDR